MEEIIERIMSSGFPFRYDLPESTNTDVLDELRSTMNDNKLRYVYHNNIFLFYSEEDFNTFKFLI